MLSAVRIRLWNGAGELAPLVCRWAVCKNQAGKQVLSRAGLAGSSSGEVTRGERTPGLLLVFLGVLRLSWTLERTRIPEDSRPEVSASKSSSLARLNDYTYLFRPG